MRNALYFSIALLSVSATVLADDGYPCAAGPGGCMNTNNSASPSVDQSFVVGGKSTDHNDDYQRTGREFYVYGGYRYTHTFLTNTQQTASNSTSSVGYIPNSALPDNFNGLEIGIGKAMGYFVDLQLAYLQQLTSSTNSTINNSASTIYTKMQGVKGDAVFIINPDDPFQVDVALGATVANYDQSITVGTAAFYPSYNTTQINPNAGLEFVYNITNHFAVRADTDYTFSLNNRASDGDFGAMIGMSYTL